VPLWSLATWLYTGLSLTLIRMIPVALAVLGLRLQPWTPVFLGWFGPRGLASILFALLILENAIPHRDQILAVVVATVAASILLHGMSASVLARRYGRYIEARQHPGAHEHMPIEELPLRKRLKQVPPS
jgi:NhaP-type Na+/H+ or K+/H+ antiporter